MAIRQPSIEELKSLYVAPQSGFDPTKMTSAYATGMTLQDTILQKKVARQQAEEELKKEILAAKEQAAQQQRLEQFRQNPTEPMAAQAYPDLQAKKLFEKPQKIYAKAGEAKDKIILYDTTGQGEPKFIDAPGVGAKAGTANLSSTAQARILQQSGVEGVIDELTSGVKILPEGTGKAALAKVQSLAGGRLPFAPGDPKVTAYDKLRDSVAVAIYKFISGDVGNIAASESKMARDLVPAIMDSKEVREEKLGILKRAANRAKEALSLLVSSGQAASMSAEELRKAQINIADNAISEASMEVLNSPGKPVEPSPAGNAGRQFKVIKRSSINPATSSVRG
jgi:hypothetical protein